MLRYGVINYKTFDTHLLFNFLVKVVNVNQDLNQLVTQHAQRLQIVVGIGIEDLIAPLIVVIDHADIESVVQDRGHFAVAELHEFEQLQRRFERAGLG